jgi:hypothetical protein
MLCLYDIKYQKHMGKLQMHWMGHFTIVEIHESIIVRLVKLDEILPPQWENEEHLNPYIST